MPIQILKKDGTTEDLQKTAGKPGRPRGAKDKQKRKPPRHNTVQALRKKIISLEKKVDDVTRDNDRLARGLADNPLVLTRDKEGPPLTEQELAAISSTPSGEVKPGVEDELLALTDRRQRVARLILRGVPRTQICMHLQISTRTLSADIAAIRDMWRRNVNRFSVEEVIGESLDFYREIRDLNLREAMNPLNKAEVSIQASQAALRAEDSKNAFLARLGLWDLMHDEKARAFRGERQRDLDRDQEDFAQVVSFMAQAVNGAGETVDAEYDDISPRDD